MVCQRLDDVISLASVTNFISFPICTIIPRFDHCYRKKLPVIKKIAKDKKRWGEWFALANPAFNALRYQGRDIHIWVLSKFGRKV